MLTSSVALHGKVHSGILAVQNKNRKQFTDDY
jgi:hypothetical protein